MQSKFLVRRFSQHLFFGNLCNYDKLDILNLLDVVVWLISRKNEFAISFIVHFRQFLQNYFNNIDIAHAINTNCLHTILLMHLGVCMKEPSRSFCSSYTFSWIPLPRPWIFRWSLIEDKLIVYLSKTKSPTLPLPLEIVLLCCTGTIKNYTVQFYRTIYSNKTKFPLQNLNKRYNTGNAKLYSTAFIYLFLFILSGQSALGRY